MSTARYYKFGILLLIGVALLIGVFGNGTIKEFNIKKGQPVNKGDVLVEIEL